MKVTLTLNGKSVEVDLTEEQLKTLGIEEKKKTGYERGVEGEHYWYVEYKGYVSEEIETLDMIDDDLYNVANYYSDKNVANDNARADALMRKLRRYAAEHGGIVNGYEPCYSIFYSVHGDRPSVLTLSGKHKYLGMIGFKSERDCENAIKEFYDELMWYFNHYRPQL